ncbi:hypothetical protein M885DRAFT_566266, partial [Pelagophyceae sp. CCMP2097]
MWRAAWVALALTARAAWVDDDAMVAPFDCVLRFENEDAYSIRELDIDTGIYQPVAEIDYFSGHINAVGMLETEDGRFFLVGSFGGQLCRFDGDGKECFSTALIGKKPNVGAVTGSTFYYSRNPGSDEDTGFYWVTGINSNAPIFNTAATVYVSTSLYTGSVLDVVAIDEADGFVYIDDGEERVYLIGIAEDYRVFVMRCDPSTGAPVDYAVFASILNWGTATPRLDTESTEGFGAAFRYGGTGSYQQAFFSSNAGFGFFQLELPITVPDKCWNTGLDTSTHVSCVDDVSAALVYKYPSAETNYNDGTNCPDGFDTP